MTVTVEKVLERFRKYALWAGVQIRCKSGQMGEVLGRPGEEDGRGRLMIRLDGGTHTIMERHDLFPIWWPEEEWR